MPTDRKAYLRAYYLKNKDKIRTYQQKYAVENKEFLKDYFKKYVRNNQESIAFNQATYRANHKLERDAYAYKYYQDHKTEADARGAVLVTCKCGSVVRSGNFPRHRNSKKHIDFMEKMEKEDEITPPS